MDIIVDRNGRTFPIKYGLYQLLVKEHDSFVKWLDSLDDSYELESTDVEDVYDTNVSYLLSDKTDDKVFVTLWGENGDENQDIDPSFDVTLIGEESDEGQEFRLDINSSYMAILILNFPDLIDKINETRKRLGGLSLAVDFDNEYLLCFRAYFPFDSTPQEEEKEVPVNEEYETFVIEKALDCYNKEVDAMYDDWSSTLTEEEEL